MIFIFQLQSLIWLPAYLIRSKNIYILSFYKIFVFLYKKKLYLYYSL